MDSFLVDSDPVIPKDLGEMPKQSQQQFDLIAGDDDSHSRFMAAEKSASSQNFSSEVTDLLGDSFAMSNPVPAAPVQQDNRDLFKEKDAMDDFFMGSEEPTKKNPEPFNPSSLIDIGGEPDFFGAQKKPTASVAVDDFEDANQADDLTKAKDTIESDYMNPYAEVRPKKVEEPFVVEPPQPAAAAPPSTKDDDIFNDFSSHQTKPDQFSEPLIDDSPPTPPIVIPKATPAPVVPEPVAPVAAPTPKPADPPKEKPAKPAPTPAPATATEQIQAEKIFKQFGLGKYNHKNSVSGPCTTNQTVQRDN